MESVKHQRVFNKFVLSFFVKMTTRFVLPVSVLSILVSYSSLLPFLLHTFKFSFSAYKMQQQQKQQQFFGYNIDKNCMFLLCNGILVLIVKNSGLISKSQSQSQSPQVTAISSKNVNRTRAKPAKVVEFAEPSLEEKVTMQVEAAEETENLPLVPVDTKNGSLLAQDKEKEEEVTQCLINDEDALSTEELNKRCEEFIRKMKAGIKSEARQLQPISCY